MSLILRIGRVVFDRIAPLPAVQARVERELRSVPFTKEARALAYSPLTDGDARNELEARVGQDAVGLQVALAHSAKRRGDFISDRTFRLLDAVAKRRPVAPIDEDMADLFGDEEALGRLPLREAFRRLAALEPELRYLATWDLETPAAAFGPRPYDQSSDRPAADRAAQELVGPGARSQIPIMRSDIAASIVRQYLAINARRTPGDLAKPYFVSPRLVIYTESSSGPLPHASS